VEDDKDLNAAYKLILEREHHTVTTAYNGLEALKKIKNFPAELIILDLLMPVKSGVEFLESFDVIDDHRDVTVILLTNLDNASEINEAFRLGADQCVIKSWTAPQGLIEIINNVLKSRQARVSTQHR
jgi:two-component system alkaline phosphatase synthesis response regulator PhoP